MNSISFENFDTRDVISAALEEGISFTARLFWSNKHPESHQTQSRLLAGRGLEGYFLYCRLKK